MAEESRRSGRGKRSLADRAVEAVDLDDLLASATQAQRTQQQTQTQTRTRTPGEE
jgi:hypothetical protein